MKISYEGENRYYTSLNDMYSEVNLMSLLISYKVDNDIMIAVMDGKKTNKTPYDDRPRGVEYLELDVGDRKYFIYEDKGKYYEEENKLKVFTTINISNYSLKDSIVELKSGGITPVAITYIKNGDGSYSLEEYLPSMDGSFWESSIREFCIMPVSLEEIEGLADEIINHYMNYEDILKLEREKLIQYLNDHNLKGVSLLERGYNEPDKLIPLTN